MTDIRHAPAATAARWSGLRRSVYLLAGAVFCAVLLINVARSPLEAESGIGVDFLPIRAGAQILQSDPQHLYDMSTQERTELALLGYSPADRRYFPDYYVYPPIVAWAAEPLTSGSLTSQLPKFVFIMFFAQLTLFVLTFSVTRTLPLPERSLLAVGGALSLPAAIGVQLGQISPLLALCFAMAIFIIPKRSVLGGLLLSLMIIKPQLMIAIPLVLAVSGLRTSLYAFIAGICTQLAFSTVLVHGAILSWVRLATSPRVTATIEPSIPEVMSHASGQLWLGWLLAAGAMIAFLALFIWLRPQLRAEPKLALTLAFMLAITWAPHAGNYDLIMLAMPLAVWGLRSSHSVQVALLLNASYAVSMILGVSTPIAGAVLLAANVLLIRDIRRMPVFSLAQSK